MTKEHKLTLSREREQKLEESKNNLATAIMQKRNAYAESAAVAMCGNPHCTENLTPEEIAANAVRLADALTNELFYKPLGGKDAVQEGK